MLIVDGVDMTCPVLKPVSPLNQDNDKAKGDSLKKLVEAKKDKPPSLIDCGVLCFPSPE